MSRILSSQGAVPSGEDNMVSIKSGFETYRLDFDAILFLEKEGNYMIYRCLNQRIVARETIHESLEKLPQTFIQVHKSYIVNLAKIKSYTSSELTIGKEKVPISDTFRHDFLRIIGK
jgi:DNA-binding LytR/AlgR family response regulator